MRKIIAVALWTVALAVTGCTQTELVDNPQSSGYIEYDMYAKRPTRATVLDNTNFTSFKVYAYQSINDAFSPYYNETVSRVDATKPWAGEKPRKWPTGENDFLNFYAMSDPDNAFDIVPASGTSAHGRFSYEVYDPDKQKDLLVATKFNVKNSTFSGKLVLEFKHALTQIAFKAKSASADYKMRVTKIELKLIPYAGRFEYSTDSDCGVWTGQGKARNYIFEPNNAENEFGTADVPLVLTSERGNLMLLPNPNIDEREMTVSYTVYKTADADDPGISLVKTIKLGAHEGAGIAVRQWTQGTKLTYTLVLTGGERSISFSTTVDPWETEESSEEVDASDVFDVKVINDDGGGLATRDNTPYPFTITDNRLKPGAYIIESSAVWVTITDQADGTNPLQKVNYSADGTVSNGAITRATGYEKTKMWYAVLGINDTGSDREATITVKGRNNLPDQTITVKQTKFVSWNATTNKNETLAIPGTAGVYTVFAKKASLSCIISFNPSDVNATMNWGKYEPAGGQTELQYGSDGTGDGYKKLFIFVGENPSTTDSREIKIVTKRTDEFPGTFTFQQAAGPQPKWTQINRDGFNLKWANGPLVRKDGNINECEIGEDYDTGLYFAFGSLIGFGTASHPNGTDYPVAEAVKLSVKPAAYTGIENWPGAFYEEGTPGELPITSDPVTGIGDPCRYYLGGAWRLPTSAELKAHILNNAADNSSLDKAKLSWDADVLRKFDDSDLGFQRSGYSHPSGNGGISGSGSNSLCIWSSTIVDLNSVWTANIEAEKFSMYSGWSRRANLPVRCVSE